MVIPCKNMGNYVRQAIESVLAQTLPVHEIVVVDDASTDDSRDVLQRFSNRIRVLPSPGVGVSIARNAAMLAATGEYIAFLDADDLWYPQKMEIQLQQMRTEARKLSFTDFRHSTDPDIPGGPVLTEYTAVADGDVFSNLLRENFILTSTFVMHRDALALVGLFKPHLKVGEDRDLWLRVARKMPMTWVKTPLAFKRRHLSNLTGSVEAPYLIANSWQVIQSEHQDVSSEDRAQIRYGLGLAAYDAGRHAIRQVRLDTARHYLTLAMRVGFNWRTGPWWLMLSCLPPILVQVLLRIKHKFAGANDQHASNKPMTG